MWLWRWIELSFEPVFNECAIIWTRDTGQADQGINHKTDICFPDVREILWRMSCQGSAVYQKHDEALCGARENSVQDNSPSYDPTDP